MRINSRIFTSQFFLNVKSFISIGLLCRQNKTDLAQRGQTVRQKALSGYQTEEITLAFICAHEDAAGKHRFVVINI